MTVTQTLTGGLLWSLGGGLLGFALGLIARGMLAQRGYWATTKGIPVTDMSERDAAPHEPRSRTGTGRIVIGLIILALVAVSTVRYYQITECQQGYLQTVQQSLQDRSTASSDDAKAEIVQLTAIASGDEDTIREAALSRIDALRKLEQTRRASPIPGPESCGEDVK